MTSTLFERHDHIRALARAFAGYRAPPGPHACRAALFHVAHRGRCPRCASTLAFVHGIRRVFCPACRTTSSLTARTPLRGCKLDVAVRVLAAWHIHVDTEPISAAAFARRYGIGSETALDLLHEMRRALVHVAISTTSARRQVLGGVSRRNIAVVAAAIDDDGRLALARAHDAPPAGGAIAPEASLWLGRLHAWIVDVFRGVTARRLDLYLAEFADRFRRALAAA